MKPTCQGHCSTDAIALGRHPPSAFEGIADIAIVGLDRHRLPEQFRSLFVHAACPIEIGEVDESRDEIRVETQRGTVFLFRLGHLPAPQIQQPKIEVSLRPVGIDHLGGNELGGGLDEGSLLLRRQRQKVGSGQGPRRFDADGANRIGEERCRRMNDARRRRARKGVGRKGRPRWTPSPVRDRGR